MKKIVLTSLIALAAVSASAVEVSITAGRDMTGDRNAYGVALSEKIGGLKATAAVERFNGADGQNRWSLTGSYDVAKIGPATASVTAGGAYLDNQYAPSGYAAIVGAGVNFPLTKQVSFDLGVSKQYGQDRVEKFNGTRVTTGLKYSF